MGPWSLLQLSKSLVSKIIYRWRCRDILKTRHFSVALFEKLVATLFWCMIIDLSIRRCITKFGAFLKKCFLTIMLEKKKQLLHIRLKKVMCLFILCVPFMRKLNNREVGGGTKEKEEGRKRRKRNEVLSTLPELTKNTYFIIIH